MATNTPSLQGVQDRHARSFPTAKEVCCAAKITGYVKMNAKEPHLAKTVLANTSAGYQWNADRVFVIIKIKKCPI